MLAAKSFIPLSRALSDALPEGTPCQCLTLLSEAT